MSSSLFLKITIGLLVVLHVLADEIIAPYGDSECRESISDATMNELGSTNTPTGTSIWHFTAGYPTSTNWENVAFPSANSSYGGSGKEVWWKVPQLRGGCSVVLMESFLEKSWGTVDPHQPKGNVIINTQSAGCLYSSLRDGVSLSATYCCSTSDCYNLDPTQRSISLSAKRNFKSNVNSLLTKEATITAEPGGASVDHSFDPSHCKAVNTDKEPQTVPGIQGAITPITQCNSNAPCSFTISKATTSGTTLSSSQSNSLTNSFDTSVSVTAGVIFPVQASTTVSVGYGLAKTVGSETGTDVSNSTEISVQQELNLVAGSSGYLSFTPTVQCWRTSLDCGKGPVPGFSYCNPVMVGDDPSGQYFVVYVQ